VSWTLGSNLEELDLFGNKALAGTGNALDNTLTGNSGNNVLDGKGGSDTLVGGGGADVFRFSGWQDVGVGVERDQIDGFSASEGDKIDLTALDANSQTVAVDAFKFIGSAAFSADATGELRFADGVLQGSQDANGTPEFEVRMVGLDELRSVDLVG
jgi:Ca2+-binding RTX toxin-like protein